MSRKTGIVPVFTCPAWIVLNLLSHGAEMLWLIHLKQVFDMVSTSTGLVTSIT